MRGLNPNMDQGIDIALLPGSYPMEYTGAELSRVTLKR